MDDAISMNETMTTTTNADPSADSQSTTAPKVIRTYIHYAPASRSEPIRRDMVGSDPRFKYMAPNRLSANDKRALCRSATEELYRDVTGKRPSAKKLAAVLRSEIKNHQTKNGQNIG